MYLKRQEGNESESVDEQDKELMQSIKIRK
jgi:hypothetical protein